MSKLFEDAIDRLRNLPEDMQDVAARTIIQLLEEEPGPHDDDAVANARRESPTELV